MYGLRGLGLAYDAAAMPIEDPANTTVGAQSGGTYPLAPVDSGNVCDGASKMFDANLCNNLYVPKAQTLTQWMNANSTTVMIGGLGFLALVLVMKAGR